MERGLDEVDVLFLPDERTAGEEILRVGAILEVAAQVVVRDTQAKVIRLVRKNGALDFQLAGAAHHKLQIELRQLLLLHLPLSGALDVRGLDGSGIAGDFAQDARSTHGGVDAGVRSCTIIEDAGNKGDDHRDDGGADNDRKDSFCGAIVLLQNTDHAWLTTFTSGGSPSEIALPGIFAHG
jgi:hypothetical protein